MAAERCAGSGTVRTSHNWETRRYCLSLWAMRLLREYVIVVFFFFSSRRRHTRLQGDWSSDVCSSDLRMKIMAKLDISEKRLPQDGRIMIKYRQDGKRKELDFRVSTVPTLYGEKVVLRLLDKENLRLDMTKLGFEPESLAKFERQILKPYGMGLVTGPTGSGKTNTLYSSVSHLNTLDTTIMTAEGPVEVQLNGIDQVQMTEQIGLHFAGAVRAFIRQ